MNKYVKAFNKAADGIAEEFLRKYYPDEVCPSDDIYWVADQQGGIFYINDSFWGFLDMVTALTLEIPSEKLFAWHEESLEYHQATATPDGFPNLKNYIRLDSSKHDYL